jgi:hypothetical protein
MCRAALDRRQLAKVPGCAPRHIGAHWTTTLPRSPTALAPGTAPLALRNARLPKDAPRCASVPRPRVPAPTRAARHCDRAFRKLQARPQSRFVDHDPPQPTRPALAPGTAPLALRNARLPQDAPQCASVPRSRVPAPTRAARHCGRAFRKLQAQPQSRFVDHDPPQPTRPALAPGTAALARVNARLPKQPPRCTTRLNPARAEACAQKTAHQRIHPARPPAATARAPPPTQPPQSGCTQAPFAYSCDADLMTFGQWI